MELIILHIKTRSN